MEKQWSQLKLLNFSHCNRRQNIITYWLFHLLVSLIVGWSVICCHCCVTDLMAFVHLDLSLAGLIIRCFLCRSALTTPF